MSTTRRTQLRFQVTSQEVDGGIKVVSSGRPVSPFVPSQKATFTHLVDSYIVTIVESFEQVSIAAVWHTEPLWSQIYLYITKYSAVKKLGPTNSPTQNITFPSTRLSFINFDRLNMTNGICPSCIQNK